MNVAARKHFGAPDHILQNYRIPDMDIDFTSEDVKELNEQIDVGDHKTITSRHITYNGDIIPVEISINVYINEDGHKCCYGWFKDIREKLKQEEEKKVITDKALLFQKMVEYAADPFFLVNLGTGGEFLYVNHAASKHYGVSKEKLLTMKISDFNVVYNPNKVKELNDSVEPGDHRVLISKHKVNGGKDIVPVETSINVYKNENGHKCCYGWFRNISERIEMERLQQQTIDNVKMANKAKSAFIANMSHEIRTPLNCIIGLSELLNEEISNPDHKEYIKTLISSSNNLLLLINDVLDLSKIEAEHIKVEKRVFNFRKMVDDLLDMFKIQAEKNKLTLGSKICVNVPKYVIGDEQRLRQILLNLLGNAIKFTKNGYVGLNIYCASETRIAFCVEDTGIGMSRKQVKKIFDPFEQADNSVTRKYGGTGLGLTISKRFIELMDGELQVLSEKEHGSKFMFVVTMLRASQKQINKIVSKEQRLQRKKNKIIDDANSTSKHILVADDAEDNRVLIKQFLKKTPHKITMVCNGLEAVNIFDKDNFDIILMDVQMPIMDGYTATREIRRIEKIKELEKMPIIALTAHAMVEDTIKSLEAGCDYHLTKPVRKAKLLDVISKYAIERKEI